jgi:hypothetical protein
VTDRTEPVSETRVLAEEYATNIRENLPGYSLVPTARLEALERVRDAARAADTSWTAYVEAHAGRGHEGQAHTSDPMFDGECGLCVSAEYGTEVEMGEYVMPALRAALAEPGAKGLRRSDLEIIDSEASTAHDYIWSTTDVSREQASAAIWSIHNIVRPLLAATEPVSELYTAPVGRQEDE